MRPAPSDYAGFSEAYVSLVKSNDIRKAMPASLAELKSFLEAIPDSKAGYAYAPGKWTIKELLQHTIDTERVFAYRAMCIARGEKQPLPGFDQDLYAANVDVTNRTLDSLKTEILLLRQSSNILFEHISDQDLAAKGTASNHSVTVLSFGYLIIGHWLHHQKIMQERYGL